MFPLSDKDWGPNSSPDSPVPFDRLGDLCGGSRISEWRLWDFAGIGSGAVAGAGTGDREGAVSCTGFGTMIETLFGGGDLDGLTSGADQTDVGELILIGPEGPLTMSAGGVRGCSGAGDFDTGFWI